MNNLLVFVVLFLVPGLLLLRFARKLVDLNKRLYPKLYGEANQAGALIVYYIVGTIWIFLGFVDFVVDG